MNNLKLRTRIAISSSLFIVMILFCAAKFVALDNINIAFVKSEVSGSIYMKWVMDVIAARTDFLMAQYGMRDSFALKNAKKTIDDKFAKMGSISKDMLNDLNLDDRDLTAAKEMDYKPDKIQAKWDAIASTDVTVAANYGAFNDFYVTDLSNYMSYLQDASNTSLDNELRVYHLLIANYGSAPQTFDKIADIVHLTAQNIKSGTNFQSSDLEVLSYHNGVLSDDVGNILSNLDLAMHNSLDSILGQKPNNELIQPKIDAITKSSAVVNALLSSVISGNKVNFTDYSKSLVSLQNDLGALTTVLSAECTRLLQERVAIYKTQEADLMIFLILGFIASVIAYMLCVRSITLPIEGVCENMTKLASNDVNLNVKYAQSNSEIGLIDRSIQALQKAVSMNLLMSRMTAEYPVMRCDKDLNIVFFNDAISVVLNSAGIRVSEYINKALGALHPDLAQSVNAIRGSDKKSHISNIKIGNKWIEAKIVLLEDSSGQFDGAYVNMVDVTEKTESESSVEMAQMQINNLINSVKDGNLTSRLESDKFSGFYKVLAISMNDLVATLVTPINKSITALEELSKGNLTTKMDGVFKGAFGQMQSTFNGVIDRMSETMIKIKDSASAVYSASNEISSGSADLASRTEQQASNLEETAASMEEMTQAVNQSTQRAIAANDLTAEAAILAERGGMDVKSMIEAMNGIEEYANKISEIVTVIDEIAFQTNLLALNAAVEAARAGDAGKGFAVVASEVRALAGRSSGASKEIKALITESNNKIGSGAKLATKSGETLVEIVDSVKKVAGLINEMAGSSKEQSNGISEINAAISQMDEMTQQNAALVEENSAATHSLAGQAKNLETLVGFFKISDADTKLTGSFSTEDRIEKVEAKNSKSNVVHKDAALEAESLKKPKAAQVKISESGEKILTPDLSKKKAKGKYEEGWEEF